MSFLTKSCCLLWSILFVCCGFFLADAEENQLREVQRTFTDSVRPILKNACGDCHWGDNQDAGLNLEHFNSLEQLLQARKTWREIAKRVADHEMPPEDATPLTKDERQAILSWVDELLNSVDCTNINPGRVTLRRLNRTEYQNTIRDLLGIEYRPAAGFPGDDLGYGFDNIADVLSLPPRLLEQYLDAADSITRLVVFDPTKKRFKKRIAGTNFKGSGKSEILGDSHLIFSNGSISHAINVPAAGRYRVVVEAFADQAGDEPAKMSVGVARGSRQSIDVDTRDDVAQPFETTLSMAAGRQRLKIFFLNDFFVAATDTAPNQDRNLYIKSVLLQGPLKPTRKSPQELLGHPLDQAFPKDKQGQTVLARRILTQFMARAFRRPVNQPEVDRVMQLFSSSLSDDRSFDESMQLCLQAVLVSPHFLFKIESPPTAKEPKASEPQLLPDYAMATRMSYFIWSSMPDDELFQLASQGKLKQPDVVRQQVTRMLADPKATALVDNFAAQWLKLPGLMKLQPDPDLFPDVDATLRRDMTTETKRLLADLIAQDASVLRFLDADYSFVNERLARHYGIAGIQGNEFRKVTLRGGARAGVISHASILTLTSNPTRTSPVKRGKWIMENLLGDEPPPPDPNARPLDDQPKLTGTVRERTIQHRADPNCAVCHKVMDELGFALENYDAVGRWRDQDDGQAVDARGELPDGTKFEGAIAMQTMLQTKMKDKFVRCLSEKMLIYALGRGLEYYDDCAVDDIVESLQQNDYRVSELVTAIVLSDPFRLAQTAAK